ncbi:uncharacterized protein FA14DRAFT_74209 [Meira miltonrushii]|uniref:Uncharacterized protein n=1 Tax=Meira miltonrushii TaxID=1280837 RepID=A0A316V8C9_9BASI|nr:uncharacterized protein FA14DRAFT_74209 [Meira miltonrushii]PWN32453.1 hypothetical protein FA14DRAFT_74209 [Meira miltonrushii]
MSSSLIAQEEDSQDNTLPPSTSSKPASRPGSRQRQARANAITKEGQSMNATQQHAGWSKEEEAEAIALIKEILSTGISPNQLIMQGFRPDLVSACSNQVNSGSSGEPSTSSVQLATQPKAKRKRRKAGSKGKESSEADSNSTDPANDEHTAIPSHTEKESDSQYADLLRQKVELERERTKLLRLEREREAIAPEQNVQSSVDSEKVQDIDDTQNTLAIDPMQAMRQAALASMKRKRHSNGQQKEEGPSLKLGRTVGEVSHDSHPMTPSSSVPFSPFANQGSIVLGNGSGDFESNTPPPNAPRGPKNAQPRYRDIDAPSNMEAIQREIEAAEALQSSEDADLWAIDDSNQHFDPRAASQRSKPLAYYDDVAVPAGQVDYSAPLPSLTTTQPKGAISRDRPGIHSGAKAWRENGYMQQRSLPSAPSFVHVPPRRRSPFLQNGTDQRIVLDISDDEDGSASESDSTEERIAARLYRKDNARLIYSIFKAVINGESPVSGAQARNGSPSGFDTRSLLLSKEKEIELLKEKMRLLEQKKADTEQTRAEGETKQILTESGPSDKQNITPSTPATASPSFPAYESPFTRYPGLRAMMNKSKRG